jgi:hypothetical protein
MTATVRAVALLALVRVDSQPPAVPVNAVDGILEAFKARQIVALTDARGNEEAAAFLLSLVRDPSFAATVNDIVMECGNARSQDVIDRFVRGEDVPDESPDLRSVLSGGARRERVSAARAPTQGTARRSTHRLGQRPQSR